MQAAAAADLELCLQTVLLDLHLMSEASQQSSILRLNE